MKKMIGLAVGTVAMVALSGCQPLNNAGWQGSDHSGGESVQSVDIKELENGYIIFGKDYIHNRNVEFDFCGRYYDYYRENASTQSGRFSIGNGDRLTESRINMWMNDGHTSYRIDTEDVNQYGLLEVDSAYKIKFQNEEIYIEKIQKDLDCY